MGILEHEEKEEERVRVGAGRGMTTAAARRNSSCKKVSRAKRATERERESGGEKLRK